MTDKLQRLIETATDADKVELKILHNASVACLKAYNDEPTAAKKKDLDAARTGLDAAIARMWPVYFPEEDRFENAKEAIAYLLGKGYKIAKSKFYKDRGKKFNVNIDGSINKRELLLYAKTLKYLGDPAAGLDKIQRKKVELETEKLAKQTELLDYALKVKEGAYIAREEAEMGRAAAISIIEANIRNMHLSLAAEWIDLAGGDPLATPRLIDAMGGALDDLFNRLVKMEEFVVEG